MGHHELHKLTAFAIKEICEDIKKEGKFSSFYYLEASPRTVESLSKLGRLFWNEEDLQLDGFYDPIRMSAKVCYKTDSSIDKIMPFKPVASLQFFPGILITVSTPPDILWDKTNPRSGYLGICLCSALPHMIMRIRKWEKK